MEGGPVPQRRVGRKLSRAFLRSHRGARSSHVRFPRLGPAGVLKVERSAVHLRIGLASRSPVAQADTDPRTPEQTASASSKRRSSPSLLRSIRPRLEAPAGRVRPRPSPAAVAATNSSRRIGFERVARRLEANCLCPEHAGRSSSLGWHDRPEQGRVSRSGCSAQGREVPEAVRDGLAARSPIAPAVRDPKNRSKLPLPRACSGAPLHSSRGRRSPVSWLRPAGCDRGPQPDRRDSGIRKPSRRLRPGSQPVADRSEAQRCSGTRTAVDGCASHRHQHRALARMCGSLRAPAG